MVVPVPGGVVSAVVALAVVRGQRCGRAGEREQRCSDRAEKKTSHSRGLLCVGGSSPVFCYVD